jgi:hypothetical protein
MDVESFKEVKIINKRGKKQWEQNNDYEITNMNM